MTNVRIIHLDWYSQRPPRFDGGPQLAFQGDHLSNMVVFDNAPSLPNYYLLVTMKLTEYGKPEELPPLMLEGPYWLIPSYYTNVCQMITYQVCSITDSGDYVHYSAKFKGSILPVIKYDANLISQAGMFDSYLNILNKRVNELIIASGDIEIDSELKSDSTNPVKNKVVKAAIDNLADGVNGRLDKQNLFFYPINSFTQKITENTIIDENGFEVANTNNHTTDFIKYRPGSTLIIKNGSTPANITYLAYYDQELQFISRSSMFPSTGTGIVLPYNTEYIRVCYRTTLTNLAVFMDYVVNSYPAIPIPKTRNPNVFCPSDYGYEKDTDISDWCNYVISTYPNPTILIDTSYYIDKTVTLTDGVSFKGTSRKSLIRRRNDVIMFKSFGSPYNSVKTITVDGESVQTYTEGTRRFITFTDIQIYSDSNATLFTNPIFDLKGVTLSNFVRMIISCNGKHFRCAQLQDSSFTDCHFFNSGDLASSAAASSYPSFDFKMFAYKTYPAGVVIDGETYPDGYTEYFLPVNQLTFDRCTWESYRGECFITDGYSNDIAFTDCKFESVPHVGSIVYAAAQQASEKATGILSNWKFDNCVITAHAVAQKSLISAKGAYNCTFGIKFAIENDYSYPLIGFSSIYVADNIFEIKLRFKASNISLSKNVIGVGSETNLHRALLLARNAFTKTKFYALSGQCRATIITPVTSSIADSELWAIGDYVPDITNVTNGWVCTSVNPAVFEER